MIAELARHAASALQNALRFEQERHIAETLQQALLAERAAARCRASSSPRSTSRPPARRWAATSTAPGRCADGRLALLVGDVSGKGVEAAGVTAMVRYMAEALSQHRGEPADAGGRAQRAAVPAHGRRRRS